MCCRAVWESLEVVRQESLSNEFHLYDDIAEPAAAGVLDLKRLLELRGGDESVVDQYLGKPVFK